VPRRLLVAATAPDPSDELVASIRREHEGAEVLVVAPASDLSFLDWLTSAEDAARREAERRALAAAEAEAVATHVVGIRVGDVEPITAIEDALREFPADELILVTRPEEAAPRLELDALREELSRRFELPVTHVVDDDAPFPAENHGFEAPLGTAARELVRGESPWTGFLAQFGVLLAVAAVTTVILAVVLTAYLVSR
jgi:hypothetical protein